MMKSLQMGRGLAALSVVAFHLSSMFGDPRHEASPVFSDVTAKGNLGVDFFFVLSGFIIAFAHSKDVGCPQNIGTYAFKRFIRIYPVYWLFTSVVIFGSMLTGGTSNVPHSIGDIATTISLVRFTNSDLPISPAWTLCREILFYAFFAGLILNRVAGAMLLGLWFVAVAVTFRYVPHGQWSFATDLLSAENLSFAFGILACGMSGKLRGMSGIGAFGAGLACLFALLFSEMLIGPSSLVHLLYSVTFMLVIAGAVAIEREGWMPVSALLALIGDASYTLYISHENVGNTFLKVIHRFGFMQSIDLNVLYIGVYIGIVCAALVIHLLVEKPMLQFLRQLLQRRRSDRA